MSSASSSSSTSSSISSASSSSSGAFASSTHARYWLFPDESSIGKIREAARRYPLKRIQILQQRQAQLEKEEGKQQQQQDNLQMSPRVDEKQYGSDPMILSSPPAAAAPSSAASSTAMLISPAVAAPAASMDVAAAEKKQKKALKDKDKGVAASSAAAGAATAAETIEPLTMEEERLLRVSHPCGRREIKASLSAPSGFFCLLRLQHAMLSSSLSHARRCVSVCLYMYLYELSRL